MSDLTDDLRRWARQEAIPPGALAEAAVVIADQAEALRDLAAENALLRGLLCEAKVELDWWIDQHSCCDGHQGDLLGRITDALVAADKPADQP